ncbi:DUF4373 domain-containing protein [Paenibacillus macquariensis]|uniref:Lin1244/Lin1753-like N-terminal domain-containing protein n=1 Tax=Paenibacillus macquariensis TaxID=948756 RepID=A0ABY1JS81_9BACL|nr:DUF4373 domain-containing protein [Paenibacillus macquariensis]MEC0092859.1 DUF4373 domain-containing protein [Paenibacillus macquariensis]OAB36237.1 hypothetical protein PMSM_07245 [Paenibacillus macquariensis subsp. macquariensis]SIQ67678.1 protein of unknown function [Paenibacillus macquariensis]
MKDAYYFSHDSNARHDPKISAMRGVYGAEGYGWYWMLIEMMRDSSDYKLDIQGKYTFNAFALQLQSDCKRIEEFVNDCIQEFKLFESDGDSFWSNSLLRRMDKREEVKAKRSAAAKVRWDKEKGVDGDPIDANSMQMHTPSNANAMQGKERKVKERKVNESKGNKKEIIPKIKFAEFVSLSQIEYDKLISSYGEEKAKKMIDILNNYKGASGKAYKSDYMAILNWVVKRMDEEEYRGAKAFKPNTGTSNKPKIPIVTESVGSHTPSEEEFEEYMKFAKEIQANKQNENR